MVIATTMAPLEDVCRSLSCNAADLTILNLNYQGIGNHGASKLAQALKTNQTLVVLFLDGNAISASGVKELADSLSAHPRLRQLFMSCNPIGDRGAQYLAEALNGTSLRLLKLADCQIGSAGAAAVARALRQNRTLTKLVIESNPLVGVEGAISLANGLKVNDTLTHLDLQDCMPRFHDHSSSGSQVQQAFLETLNVNHTIRGLLLQDACTSEQVGLSTRVMANQRRLQHLLDLNRLGRRYFRDVNVPNQALPRILAAASCLNGKQVSSAPSLIYAVLVDQPEFLARGKCP
jgi:Ran GTPase-activating protein (RanGAP) involved in mRNA processing and transport